MKKEATPRTTAMRLLAIREHSAHELQQKLSTKGFTPTDIATTLEALTQEGLLCNTRFLEAYIHYRRQKGYGPLRIQVELSSKGLTEDLIDPHLNITDNAWLADAQKAWQKRFKGVKPRDFKERATQMRFLQYRGFTTAHIHSIFDSDPDYD